MPVYVARQKHQLDGSPYQHLNCVPTSDAMNLDRSTFGVVDVSGGHIRAESGDTSGGLTLDQVRYVNRVLYAVDTEQQNKYAWADLPSASAHRGFILLVRYSVIRGTRFDCFRGLFSGNHAIWVNHRNADGSWHACDPGADGRPDGKGGHVPLGYMDYPDDLLRRAAGALLVSLTSSVALGVGFAQVLFSQADAIVTPPPAVVVPNAPAPKEKNTMIASAYGVVTTRRMSLAKGQPLFRSPGGPVVTRMSAAASVPYIGKAGPGWGAVVVSTGGPYADHVVRPTGLYVPSAAGTVK